MARYAATEKALEKGLSETKPAAGSKLVDDWLDQLKDFDKRGGKGLVGDLTKLRSELERETPREANVLKLVAKLGAATTKFAAGAEGVNVEKLKALGEALSNAGQAHGGEDNEAEADSD